MKLYTLCKLIVAAFICFADISASDSIVEKAKKSMFGDVVTIYNRAKCGFVVMSEHSTRFQVRYNPSQVLEILFDDPNELALKSKVVWLDIKKELLINNYRCLDQKYEQIRESKSEPEAWQEFLVFFQNYFPSNTVDACNKLFYLNVILEAHDALQHRA